MSRFAGIGEAEVPFVAQWARVARGTDTGGRAPVGAACAPVITGVGGADPFIGDFAPCAQVTVRALTLETLK